MKMNILLIKHTLLLPNPKALLPSEQYHCLSFLLRNCVLLSNPNAFVLSGECTQHVEPRTMQNKFKAYLAEGGIEDANFHSLRHTFATRCVEIGFDIKTLSEILGHSSVKITLDKYVHSSLELKRSNMEKLQPIVGCI